MLISIKIYDDKAIQINPPLEINIREERINKFSSEREKLLTIQNLINKEINSKLGRNNVNE